MKTLALIHPLFQCLSFLVGAYNFWMGLSRKGFTYRRHRGIGTIYYAMSLLGLVGGWLLARWLREGGVELHLGNHLEVAFLMVPLFLVAASLGLILRRRPRLRSALLPLHRYLNLATLLFFLLQAYTGFSALFRLYSYRY
jgi:hypothetical protein